LVNQHKMLVRHHDVACSNAARHMH
jgi:hypothetical protein